MVSPKETEIAFVVADLAVRLARHRSLSEDNYTVLSYDTKKASEFVTWLLAHNWMPPNICPENGEVCWCTELCTTEEEREDDDMA